MIKNSPDSSPSVQSERCSDRPVGHLGVNMTLNKVWQSSRQETTLRTGAGSATPVQAVAAPAPGIRAKYISIALGPLLKGLPSM
jgi:hypothetical protein